MGILINRLVISEASRNTRYGTESVVKTAIRNLLLCYYSRRFRISELTSNVPYAVRSTLRNDFSFLAKNNNLVYHIMLLV